jgi:hypothetical protein
MPRISQLSNKRLRLMEARRRVLRSRIRVLLSQRVKAMKQLPRRIFSFVWAETAKRSENLGNALYTRRYEASQ